ncbi:glycoside hydrolase family 2 protein [Polaribacter sp. L3A8]|uniref:glycoside hydrolase family 2 protein n=1 Tax=Polaribacter sp. L3A8 TaxID=2686361 RepID=UPI00131E12B5|nr:glycoside hydrolase family 2 TIM barrel-domain containing protein [Polaribacter sp. L3A8]
MKYHNFRIRKSILAFFIIALFSLKTNAQKKVYLSGEDASTAVDWEFKISDGRNSGFWTTIPVPSNWETEGFGYYLYGMDKMDKRTTPVGFYRHTFNFSKASTKRYFMVFQGAMTDTKVTLNGKNIGFHQGGFTEFKFEITNALKEGKNNLEVEVNSSSSNKSIVEAERFADFWMFSGIFRPVFIEEVSAEFIEHVAIDAQMTGDFNMWVYTNGIKEAKTITAQVYDKAHNKVGKPFKTKISKDKTILASSFKGVNLWSNEFPNLYSVKIELKSKTKVLHTYKQTFGFRTFEVRDHDGFYLNGKRILLKGANMHSFRPETGRTLSKTDMEETLRLMQDLNFNCVRPCHYPPDSYFFELCDSLGMLSMDETTGWYRPLDTQIGTKIVKEIVTRDVNHPSVILWSNGNHVAHNPELDPVFLEWDIQKRRPLKNEAKNNDIFANYNPDWDIVNTTYYPNYKTINHALFKDNHIYLPNETLHALYDGGGGANLKTYWDLFEKSKVGGGLMIWALNDEGLMRTDMGYVADNQFSKASDGIVGPHGEKDGSFYAVREIWSPVFIENDKIKADFNGDLDFINKFYFTNLNQCNIKWKLINFANPDGTINGHRTLAKGKVSGNVLAGNTGKLNVLLPASFVNNDALSIEVYDPKGGLVYSKNIPIKTSKRPTFRTSINNMFVQDKEDKFTFYYDKTTFKFDTKSAVLLSVKDNGKATSIKNFPFLTFKSVDSVAINNANQLSKATVTKSGNKWVIEVKNTKGFDYLKWTLHSGGEIALDYAYTLPSGAYNYAGIGMAVDAKDVLRKRWLGEGPTRIWNNRTEGGILDVYAVEKQVNIPGQVYNSPEFEGCFAPWNWAVFYLKDNLNLAFKNSTNVTLGVLNPVNGKGAKKAAWQYPKEEGFFFFDYIDSVGSKWKAATEFGPDAQPHKINGQIKGAVSMYVNWNKPLVKAKRVDVEIE